MKQEQPQQQAFVDLVYEHQGILHRICRVYARTKQDREDLYQEMLYQLWRSFPSFGGRSKFSTWMYRVALNTALLGQRKRSRRSEYVSRSGRMPEVAVQEDGEADEEVEMLYRCIHELPELDRAIILLYLERHTYEEIAGITGLSRSNVSVRIVRIKAKLQKLLLSVGYHAE
jgi:RNA polymerase sigma factor (sigma-70 family)